MVVCDFVFSFVLGLGVLASGSTCTNGAVPSTGGVLVLVGTRHFRGIDLGISDNRALFNWDFPILLLRVLCEG